MTLYSNFYEIVSGSIIGDCNDTNILSTIHLSENDHTNILWQILSFRHNGEYPFLKSFFDKVLNLRYDNYFDSALLKGSGTQYQAIPSKGANGSKNDAKGFIDLLLKGEKSVVIIENKVCGAADVPEQLVRYYHSFVPLDESEYTLEYYSKIKHAYEDYHSKNEKEYNHENVFVVYLTQDGKEPNAHSVYNLQKQLGEKFISISYISGDDDHKSIVDWLKDDVLPNVPYLKSGMLAQSVMMYLDYLMTTMVGENNDCTADAYNNIRYRELFRGAEIRMLVDEQRDNAKSSDREYANQYDRCLRYFINKKLNEIIEKSAGGEGWQAYWTTGYIMLYKAEWAKYGTFRNFNKVHWEMLRSMNSTPDYMWSMHMEGAELSTLAKEHEDELKHIFNVKKVNASGQIQKVSDFGNANKTYLLSLPDNEIKAYFEKLLSNSDFKSLTEKTEEWLNKYA